MKRGKAKQGTTETLTTIAYDFDDVLDLLQAVAVKSQRFIAAPLSLSVDKCTRLVLSLDRRQPPHASQSSFTRPHGSHRCPDQRGDPVAHCRSTPPYCRLPLRGGKGYQGGGGRLPPTAQHIILAASATTGTSIPTSPPTTIHRFLNARNATALHTDYSLTYAGKNIYFLTTFFQAHLHGQILDITDPAAPTRLLHLVTPLSSGGPAKTQQRAMRIQVLLSMGQDCLSKREEVKLLGQRVHVLPSTQELRHLNRNFVNLAGEYLGEESPICLSMGAWPRHIDRFDWKYDKAFARDPSLGRIRWIISTNVFIFFQSCNTTAIEDVVSGALAEFGGFRKRWREGSD